MAKDEHLYITNQRHSVKLLLVAATYLEIQPTIDFLEKNAKKIGTSTYQFLNLSIHILLTGIGAFNTGFAMAKHSSTSFDLAVNVGIAGAFDLHVTLGTVFNVLEDRFADLGVEDKDGAFLDLFQLGLMDENQLPYQSGWLRPKQNVIHQLKLPKARSITVNKVHGSLSSITAIQNKYSPDLESMEGAAFFYACYILDYDALQLRSISNHIGPRDKSLWDIPLAVTNLHHEMINLFEQMCQK